MSSLCYAIINHLFTRCHYKPAGLAVLNGLSCGGLLVEVDDVLLAAVVVVVVGRLVVVVVVVEGFISASAFGGVIVGSY